MHGHDVGVQMEQEWSDYCKGGQNGQLGQTGRFPYEVFVKKSRTSSRKAIVIYSLDPIEHNCNGFGRLTTALTIYTKRPGQKHSVASKTLNLRTHNRHFDFTHRAIELAQSCTTKSQLTGYLVARNTWEHWDGTIRHKTLRYTGRASDNRVLHCAPVPKPPPERPTSYG